MDRDTTGNGTTQVGGGLTMRLNEWVRSEGRAPGRYRGLLFGALIGALLVSLVWLITGAREDSSGSAVPPAGTNQATDATSAAPSDSSAPNDPRDDSGAAHLYRCREVYAAQVYPLVAAADAMSQWQVHIAAMNKLVLGVITLQQANQFWNQTRIGAREHLDAFTDAVERFDQRTMHCLPVGPGPAGPHLERCEQAVMVRNRVLAAARVALHTWAIHVRHMEMLRSGMMSPARATQLWLHSWHEGQREVTRYRTAATEARAAPAPC